MTDDIAADPASQRPVLTEEDRRLALLTAISELGGVMRPRRNPMAPLGHEYIVDGDDVEPDLKFLVLRDYLEKKFFDRISVCPRCTSHHLNIREICPSCGSNHVSYEPLLHHFKCSHIGRVSDFEDAESGKLICPKCATQLKYQGTDHDLIGKSFLCLDCRISFQDPPASAICLSCETETPADQLSSLEIWTYLLASLGTAALRRGSLFERDAEVLYIAGLTVYRPSVMQEMVQHEARRAERYKTPLTILTLTFETQAAAGTGEGITRVLDELRKRLRTTDIVGQINDTTFITLLADTPAKGAQIVLKRLRLQTSALGIPYDAALTDITRQKDVLHLLEQIQGRQ